MLLNIAAVNLFSLPCSMPFVNTLQFICSIRHMLWNTFRFFKLIFLIFWLLTIMVLRIFRYIYFSAYHVCSCVGFVPQDGLLGDRCVNVRPCERWLQSGHWSAVCELCLRHVFTNTWCYRFKNFGSFDVGAVVSNFGFDLQLPNGLWV